MEWFFDGLGTLIIGLIVGGTGGSLVTWRVTSKNNRQSQRAGEKSSQIQAGGDVRNVK